MHYDSKTGSLTIGARSGSFPGMTAKRTFKVRWIKDGGRAPADLDAPTDVTIEYDGAAVTVPGGLVP